MGLNIENLWVWNIAGVEIWITETIFNTWLIMLFLIVLALITRVRLRKFRVIPTGFQNIIEIVVEMFDNFARNTLGDKLLYIAPWFFMVFAFILLSALFSVFGLRAPTADWATTFALAFASFILMVFMGIKHRKGQYLKSFFEPHFIFFPLNFIGELAKPVSLSFRLFGNMLSGTIILTLYYSLTPVFVQIGIPSPALKGKLIKSTPNILKIQIVDKHHILLGFSGKLSTSYSYTYFVSFISVDYFAVF